MGERGAPLVNVCQCINECVMKIINAAMWCVATLAGNRVVRTPTTDDATQQTHNTTVHDRKHNTTKGTTQQTTQQTDNTTNNTTDRTNQPAAARGLRRTDLF
jgi:hypothetical protein